MFQKTDQTVQRILPVAADEAYEYLMGNLQRAGWKISYAEDFTLNTGVIVRQVFGVSSAFAGAGINAFMNQGAEYVPFFVKINSLDEGRSELLIIAAGSQSISGEDYGRKQKVAEKLFDFCQKPPPRPASSSLGDSLRGLFGGKKDDEKKKKR